MSDYISRDAAKKILSMMLTYNAAECACNLVDCVLPADVEPVRHGAWCQCFEDWRQQQEGNKCSVCGFEYYGTGGRTFHYCPSCGAKMDSEDKTDDGTAT